MVVIGEVEVMVKVDTSRVLSVLQAVEMYERLLLGYGHAWTHEETVIRSNALLALERKNLAVESS